MIDQIFHNFSLIVEGIVMFEVEGMVGSIFSIGLNGSKDYNYYY